MNKDEKLDDEVAKYEIKIQELERQLEIQRQEEDSFLSQLNVSLKQLKAYADNKDNFTDKSWDKLSNEKKILDDKLKLELASVRDPRKIKRSYASLQSVERHWLYVR